MQSVSSRIWTRVAVFISFDDNDYTTWLMVSSLSPHSFSFAILLCLIYYRLVMIIMIIIINNKVIFFVYK